MSDGSTKPVEKVKRGDSVMASDPTTGSIVTASVLLNKKTTVQMVEVINNGGLIVTPLNQPIYARNESYTGWIANPADLKIGWQLFCPLNQSWINITEIHFEIGEFKVYDIEATSPNNYIANGLLLDKKLM